MNKMVEANTLILGSSEVLPKDSKKVRRIKEASRHLLQTLKVVRVSAVAWAEVRRYARPGEEEFFSRLTIITEPFDGPMAVRAVELLESRNRIESVCRICLGAKDEHECAACGRRISSQQRVNDSYIAATADVLPGIEILYSCDSGVHAFAKYMQQCRVEWPPHSDGRPTISPD